MALFLWLFLLFLGSLLLLLLLLLGPRHGSYSSARQVAYIRPSVRLVRVFNLKASRLGKTKISVNISQCRSNRFANFQRNRSEVRLALGRHSFIVIFIVIFLL